MVRERQTDDILSAKTRRLKREAEERPYFDNKHEMMGREGAEGGSGSESEDDGAGAKKGKRDGKGVALLRRVYGGGKGGAMPQPPSRAKRTNPLVKLAERVATTYKQVANHLDEHQAEGVGDPKDAKQSRELKRAIKAEGAAFLMPASKVPRRDELWSVSNPRKVQANAFKLYGKDAVVYKSQRAGSKYQMQDARSGKWVHFGDANHEDFTKHGDKERQANYLKRAMGMKGKWRENPFSANLLSIALLWNGW